jgi:acylphosphatase
LDAKALLTARVYGRVQGVFFRDFVSERGVKLGLSGYVRNLPDGSVEVKAEGEKMKLDELLVQIKKGPPRARVERLSEVWSEFTGAFSGFIVTI